MNLLELFFIISGIIIFFLALDIARKEKFNALHFFVFISIGGGLLVFTFFPEVLNTIGRIFGIPRGADVLVYGAIIFLLYFVLLLLSKVESNKHNISRFVRELAILSSDKKIFSCKELILVRVYNESEVLQTTLSDLYGFGYTNMLIIDDGSSDTSGEIIEHFSRNKKNIITLKHSQNRGAGAALETGFEYIRRYIDTQYIITFDSDGQHRVEEIQKFITALEKHPELDIVFGSRFFGHKNHNNIPFFRRYILRAGRIFTRIISGSKLSDSHNGFRAFRKNILSCISLSADTMEYASELTEQIMKYKISYGEIPVDIRYTEYSLKKGQRSSNAIFIGFHVVWSKFFK